MARFLRPLLLVSRKLGHSRSRMARRTTPRYARSSMRRCTSIKVAEVPYVFQVAEFEALPPISV